MKDNKKLTIIALVAAVICLSVGFAAFSSTLNINSTASINPTSNFHVLFADTVTANGNSTTFTSYTTNNVNGTGTNGATGGSAVINNSDKTSPNLSNVTANFTAPGQSVTYSLYVVDDSNYDAYITAITKTGTQTCTAGTGTTESLVEAACSDISVSAVLDNSTIFPQTITKKGYKPLVVTLTYASDAAAVDGAFTITFEDIEITASTLSGNNGGGMLDPLVNDDEKVAYEVDLGEKELSTLALGDIVSIGDEDFMYISKDDTNAYVIAKYNLNVGEYQYKENNEVVNDGIQDSHVRGVVGPITDYCHVETEADDYSICLNAGDYFYGGVPFDTTITNFGTSYTDISDISGYSINNYLTSYKTYLSGLLGYDVGIKLPDASIFTSLGLNMQDGSCTNCSILNGVSFWTGFVGSTSSKIMAYVFNYSTYVENPTAETLANSYIFYDGIITTTGGHPSGPNGSVPSATGVRPVIIIPLSKL